MSIPPIRVVIQGIDQFTATIGKSLSELDKVGKKMQNIGRKMTASLTLPILGIGAAGIIASTSLNEGMANVASLMPNSTERVLELKEAVKGLSVDTGKAMDDITRGLYQTISAFGDSAETVDRLNVALKASVTGAADTQITLSMLSGVTKSYGDTSAKALTHVSDLALKCVELGETTFPELANELGKVNSLASTMGVTQEEMFAAIAAGSGPLGNTGDVATKMKGALVSLLKPTKDMETAFGKLGVKSGQQLIKQEGLHGALMRVAEISKKYDIGLGKIFGSAEALQFVFSMTGAQSDTFLEKLKLMGNVGGTTEKAFNEITNGVNKAGFTFKQFKQILAVTLTEIGDALAPALVKMIAFAKPLIATFRQLSGPTKMFIMIMAGIVAAIGPLIFVIGNLLSAASAIGGVIASAGGVGALIASIFNPVTLIIGGIVALIAVLKMAGLKWKEIWRLMLIPLTPFVGIVEWIIDNWKRLIPFFKLMGILIVAIFKTFAPELKRVLDPLLYVLDKIIGAVKWVLSSGLGIAEKLAGRFLPEEMKSKIGLLGAGKEALPAETRAGVAATGPMKTENEVRVIFGNPPAGTKVERVKGDLDIETWRGGLLPALGG